jgi:hypothetical protein
MVMALKRVHIVSTAALLFACGDSESAAPWTPAADAQQTTTTTPAAHGGSGTPAVAAPGIAAASGVVAPSGFVTDPATGELVFRTDPVELAGGEETYTCFAATLAQDEVIDGFSKGSVVQPFVHHIQFAKTLDGAEPAGLSECNVLFKLNWVPIYLTGAGSSELRLDEGTGHKLPAGTQLIAQLHLLNATDKPVNEQVEIRMHRSTAQNTIPVNTWVVGSSQINLAPQQPSRVQNLCTVKGAVDLVAVFPHMHMMGTRLQVDSGKTVDSMSMTYLREPYDFDDQHMENFKLSLQDGDQVRVTCDYQNTTDAVAQFGESSRDEMCFFIGFALGDPPLADCPGLWEPIFAMLNKG